MSTLERDAEVVFLHEPTLGLESSLELPRELRRIAEEERLASSCRATTWTSSSTSATA